MSIVLLSKYVATFLWIVLTLLALRSGFGLCAEGGLPWGQWRSGVGVPQHWPKCPNHVSQPHHVCVEFARVRYFNGQWVQTAVCFHSDFPSITLALCIHTWVTSVWLSISNCPGVEMACRHTPTAHRCHETKVQGQKHVLRLLAMEAYTKPRRLKIWNIQSQKLDYMIFLVLWYLWSFPSFKNSIIGAILWTESNDHWLLGLGGGRGG